MKFNYLLCFKLFLLVKPSIIWQIFPQLAKLCHLNCFNCNLCRFTFRSKSNLCIFQGLFLGCCRLLACHIISFVTLSHSSIVFWSFIYLKSSVAFSVFYHSIMEINHLVYFCRHPYFLVVFYPFKSVFAFNFSSICIQLTLITKFAMPLQQQSKHANQIQLYFNINSVFDYLIQIQQIQSKMITRRQTRRQVEENASVDAKSQPKLTKKQLMDRKNNKKAQTKGDTVAAKKIKQQEKPKSQPKKAQIKAKKGKKQTERVQDKKQNVPDKKQKVQNTKKQDVKDEKKKQTSKVRSERSKSPQRKAAKQPQQKKQEPKQNVKKIIMKGKIPIDDKFPLDKAQYHVLEHQGKVYSATLNQTNVSNNNNKFYIIQVLQSDSNSNNNLLFCRWGRVGVTGQLSCSGAMNINIAIANFNSKFKQKHDKGDYRQVDLNYGEDEEDKDDQTKQQEKSKLENKPQVQSKLQKPVKELINLIFDIKMMNRQMKEIGYNVDKMPLGKLSKDNIKKGFGILNDLLNQITKKKRRAQIQELTNDFYSFIPHDFGFQKMSNFILDDEQKVKNKIQMLQALAEIKVATNLLSQTKVSQNVLDSNYAKLNRDIEHINPSTKQYQTIKQYLLTTHGKHHSNYTLELVDLFKINDERQNVRYTKDIPNKKLLWHGSRLTNFVGILSQGLRIAPPEAPVSGYMFGKGVYFADMSSKSANYCSTSVDNPTGILLLCEVALGQMNQKEHADFYASNLPPGKQSTKGLGKIVPDPKCQTQLQKGVVIPMGPSIQLDQNFRLRYNEFIVYDIAQIKIKYLLRTKFNYANLRAGFY